MLSNPHPFCNPHNHCG